MCHDHIKGHYKGTGRHSSATQEKVQHKKGTRVTIMEGEGRVILIRPLPDDPIEASRGMLKGNKSLTKALLKDRQEEAKRG